MRRLILLTFAALALAQGRQTKEAFYLTNSAGPGYVQNDFLRVLFARLNEEYGPRRATSMIEHVRGAGLDKTGVLALVNGVLEDEEIRLVFGLAHERPQFVRKAIDAAVIDKDKKILFGALVRTMVEKGVDPSSDFCQLGESRDKLSAQQFDRLCRGEVSGSLIGDCFRLRSRKDQNEMRGYIEATWASPYIRHPIGASLAQRAKVSGAYDPKRFPKPRDGMPGYGNEYEDGRGGGLPIDGDLPPVPYYGANLDDFFKTK